MKIKFKITLLIALFTALTACSEHSDDGGDIKTNSNIIKNEFSTSSDAGFSQHQFPYPELGAQVGQGWNSVDEKPATDICIEFSEIKEKGHEVRTTFHDVQNRHHLNQILQVSTAAKTKFSGVSASASAKFSREIDLSSGSRNLMVQVLVDHGDSYAGPIIPKEEQSGTGFNGSIRLKEQYLMILRESVCSVNGCTSEQDGKRREFLLSCGDSYVAKINRGGELFVNYKMKESSETEETNFSLKLKASGYGSKGSLKIDTTNNIDISNSVEDFEVYQRGGPKLPIPVNLDSIFSSVQSFVVGQGDEEFVERPYTIVANSYVSLPNVRDVSFSSVLAMDELVSISGLYRDLLKTLRQVESNPLPDGSGTSSLYDNDEIDSNKEYLVFNNPSYFIAAENSLISARSQIKKIGLNANIAKPVEDKLVSQLMVIGFIEHLSMRGNYDFKSLGLDDLKIDANIDPVLYNDTNPATLAKFQLINYTELDAALKDMSTQIEKSACGRNIGEYVWRNFSGEDLEVDKSVTWNGRSLRRLQSIFNEARVQDVPLGRLLWNEASYKGALPNGGNTTHHELSIPIRGEEQPFVYSEKVFGPALLTPYQFKEIGCWKSISSNTWSAQNLRNIIIEVEVIQLLIEKALNNCFNLSADKSRICEPSDAIALASKGMDDTVLRLDNVKYGSSFDGFLKKELGYKSDGGEDKEPSVSVAVMNINSNDSPLNSLGVDPVRERMFNNLINVYLAPNSENRTKDFTELGSKLYYHYLASVPSDTKVLTGKEVALNWDDGLEVVLATRNEIARLEILPTLIEQNDYFCEFSRMKYLCLSSPELLEVLDNFTFDLPVGYHDNYKKKRYCKFRSKFLERPSIKCKTRTYHTQRRILFDLISSTG